MSREARRLRVAMAVQHGRHEAELAEVWSTVHRLEARTTGLERLESRVEQLARLVAEAVSAASQAPDLDLDPGLGLADDGGPRRPPPVPALSLHSSAGDRAFDALIGGTPVGSR